MMTYHEQLDRFLEMLMYVYHKSHRYEGMDNLMYTLEHFMSQGRPLNEQVFKLIDRNFVRTGELDTKPFWGDNYDD